MNVYADSALRIGTSGIVVPGNKLDFPEQYRSGSRLHYYGSLFNTLEVNSSFYKIPLPTTFAKWETEVPQDFTFTVKLWRGITHAKKLDFNNNDIHTFMRAISFVAIKSGCLLIQFPASIGFAYRDKVEEIIQQVKALDNCNKWKLAIELRHVDWYRDATYQMLDKYGAALVFHDMPKSSTPIDCFDFEFVYCRFHGPNGDYKGSYTPDTIQQCATRIRQWRKNGKEVYIYFNNTMEGALENAQLLQSLL